MKGFLLRPGVTVAAIAGTVGGIALAFATVTQPLQDLFGKPTAAKIADVCLIIAAVCGPIAGLGRSPLSSVDSPKP